MIITKKQIETKTIFQEVSLPLFIGVAFFYVRTLDDNITSLFLFTHTILMGSVLAIALSLLIPFYALRGKETYWNRISIAFLCMISGTFLIELSFYFLIGKVNVNNFSLISSTPSFFWYGLIILVPFLPYSNKIRFNLFTVGLILMSLGISGLWLSIGMYNPIQSGKPIDPFASSLNYQAYLINTAYKFVFGLIPCSLFLVKKHV